MKNLLHFFKNEVFSNEIPHAIKKEFSVAVERRTESDFYCVGTFRAVKYVRFLMDEYYPDYEKLCEEHVKALEKGKITPLLRAAEKNINKYNSEFFCFL